MKRKTAERIVYGTTALLIALGGYAVGRMTKIDSAPREAVTETIMVHSGDTLWSIAKEHGHGDPRAYISDIMRINDLDDAVIYPGQMLQVVHYE
jgi:hypothetical protein